MINGISAPFFPVNPHAGLSRLHGDNVDNAAVPLNPASDLGQSRDPSQQWQTGNSAATDHQSNQENPQQAKQDQKMVEQLQRRDREVRAHEAAHKASAGSLGGAPHYDLQTGPDGKRYAVGGEVSIDMAEVSGDPQATLIKANRIKSAALAPVDPSAQDRAIAAKASAMAAEAIKQMNAEKRADTGDVNKDGEDSGTTATTSGSMNDSQSAAVDSRSPRADGERQDQDHVIKNQPVETPSLNLYNQHALTAYQANHSGRENALHLVA